VNDSPTIDLSARPTRWLLAATLALLAASCGRPSADGGDGDEVPIPGALERPRAAKVQTAPLAQREMVSAISAIVNAESERQIEVFPRTTGLVTDVLVEEGDRVEEGEALMVLDTRELEAALNEARITEQEARDTIAGLELAVSEAEAGLKRAELTATQARRELERKEEVESVLSRNELDQLRLAAETADSDVAAAEVGVERAKAAVATQRIAIVRAEAQVARAELDLSFATTVAPFAGVIARRDVRVGDLVSNAAAAFVLSDIDNVRAVVSRPQRELGLFGRAARANAAAARPAAGSDDELAITLEPDALPGVRYDGRILFVSPTVDPASGQFRVTLGVEQPGPDDPRPMLLPGMQVRVRIVTDRHPDALVVPKRAIVREGDRYHVFVVEDGRARRVRVEEGFTTDDDVEVLPYGEATLEAGADVVVVGNRDLEDGAAVDATRWAGAGPVAPDGDGDDAATRADGSSNGDASNASGNDGDA